MVAVCSLCHRFLLEGGPGFLSIAYINIACGVCTSKCFWGTLAVLWLHPFIMGVYYGKLLCQLIEVSHLVEIPYPTPVTVVFEWLWWWAVVNNTIKVSYKEWSVCYLIFLCICVMRCWHFLQIVFTCFNAKKVVCSPLHSSNLPFFPHSTSPANSCYKCWFMLLLSRFVVVFCPSI